MKEQYPREHAMHITSQIYRKPCINSPLLLRIAYLSFFSFQVTHSSVVPPVVLLLAKHPAVDNYDLSNLTEITNGAAPLGEEISKEVMKRLPLLSRVRQGKKSGFQTSLGSSKIKVIMSFPSPDRLRHDRTKSSMSHDSF